jgi:NADPH-dependent curcumin reductase CurA
MYFHQTCSVKLPDAVDYQSAVCTLGVGLEAYLALHYLGHVSSGDTVLIMNAASAFGILAIQLAHLWNAKVCYVRILAIKLGHLWNAKVCYVRILAIKLGHLWNAKVCYVYVCMQDE